MSIERVGLYRVSGPTEEIARRLQAFGVDPFEVDDARNQHGDVNTHQLSSMPGVSGGKTDLFEAALDPQSVQSQATSGLAGAATLIPVLIFSLIGFVLFKLIGGRD